MTPELPEIDDPPRHYRIVIDKTGKDWVQANHRVNYHAKARMVRNWRDITAWKTRNLDIHIERAFVICELRFKTTRRRDPANWAPTAKAVIDALVDNGIFPDDDHSHLIGPDMRIGPPVINGGPEQLIVHIWPYEEKQ